MTGNLAHKVLLDRAFAHRFVLGFGALIEEHWHYLTQLDAAIGDADHGINMRRGMKTVYLVVGDLPRMSPGELFHETGTRLAFTVGGAAGPLYGTVFLSMAQVVADDEVVMPGRLVAATDAALAGIRRLGAAEEGDKTMVDAFAPAVRAMRSALTGGREPAEVLDAAARAAAEGMTATIPLRALKGRASYLGPRSEGHQDPGATSTALLFQALATAC